MGRRTERLVRFNAEWLDSVSVESREEWHDEAQPGLVVRVGPSGSRVFYWVGRVAGQQTRMKIGQYPKLSVVAARNEAKRISGEVASGNAPKPRARASRDEWNLDQLFDWYLTNHAKPHKRTWLTDERRYRARLSQWGHRKLSRIPTQEVTSLHINIGKTDGHYAANKMLELLGAMYRLAKRKGLITADDPTATITRFPKVERERFLDADELPRFLEAIQHLKRESSRDFLLLCLFTGARRSNVQQMRWDELRLESATWTIPAEKSKNKREMTIPLSPPAMDILNRRKESASSHWVLPGQGSTGHLVEPRDAMKKTLERAGLKNVRLHDLRRTLGSWMAAAGTSLQIIGKTLGHTSPKSTAIYSRLNLEPVRAALEVTSAAMIAKKPEKN